MTKLTQTEKLFRYLSSHGTQYPGVTAARIASDTKIPRASVRKRIYDLRTEGVDIYTNVRKQRSYYRFAN